MLDPSQFLDLAGIGGRFAHAWSTLPTYVRTGKPGYHELVGMPFWDDLAAGAKIAASFDALIGPAGHGAPDPQFEITGGWKSVRTVVDVGGGTGQAAERFARFFGHTNLHCHSIDHRRHLDRAQRGFSPHRPGAWRPPTTSRLVEARRTTHSRPRR